MFVCLASDCCTTSNFGKEGMKEDLKCIQREIKKKQREERRKIGEEKRNGQRGELGKGKKRTVIEDLSII